MHGVANSNVGPKATIASMAMIKSALESIAFREQGEGVSPVAIIENAFPFGAVD